jgi:hypothetical protein
MLQRGARLCDEGGGDAAAVRMAAVEALERRRNPQGIHRPEEYFIAL